MIDSLSSASVEKPPETHPSLWSECVAEIKQHPGLTAAAMAGTLVGGTFAVCNVDRIGLYIDRAAGTEYKGRLFEGLGELQSNGKLAAGLHKATWSDFSERFAFNGRRQHLLSGLQAFLHGLGEAGCREARIGGSFVTTKEVPGDFDAVWVWDDAVDSSKLHPNLVNNKIWDMQEQYGGDIFSTRMQTINFGSAFPKRVSPWHVLDRDRLGRRLGIVSIDPRTVPAPTESVEGSFVPKWLKQLRSMPM